MLGSVCLRGLLLGVVLLGMAVMTPRALAEGLPVVPGAGGFAVATAAGRGGDVLKVTTLAPRGLGSLREAIQARGPRTIVFEVGGVIDMQGEIWTINRGDLTIAGQTAPAPGITLINGGLSIRADDVLIQHIAIRTGRGRESEAEEAPLADPFASPGGASRLPSMSDELAPKLPGGGRTPLPKTLHIAGAKRVVFDHCSISWGQSITVHGYHGPATFLDCIISESLRKPANSDWGGNQSIAMQYHEGTFSMDGCLFANNGRWQPLSRGGLRVLLTNIVVHNPEEHAIQFSTPGRMVVRHALMKAGPASEPGARLFGYHHVRKSDETAFVEGAVALNREGEVDASLLQSAKVAENLGEWSDEMEAFPEVELVPMDRLLDHVLKYAGMRPAERNTVDARIVREVREGKGRIIDSQEQVGGYPDDEPTYRKFEVPASPNADPDGDGYTNLEELLHRMAAEVEGRSPAAE